MARVIRHIELIDDEALEYGIKIVKCSDRLMAKKFGFRNPPGITYFRKGKFINYDGKIANLQVRVGRYYRITEIRIPTQLACVNNRPIYNTYVLCIVTFARV